MSAEPANGKAAVIKYLIGTMTTIVFLWVGSLQASIIRLVQEDSNIKTTIAQKSEVIAAHESLLQQIIPQLVRIEYKIDKQNDYLRNSGKVEGKDGR